MLSSSSRLVTILVLGAILGACGSFASPTLVTSLGPSALPSDPASERPLSTEPAKSAGKSSASILAIAPDSTVRWTITIVDP